MSLYSLWNHQNNKIEAGPKLLPKWFKDSNGMVHNDMDTMTTEELATLGWYETQKVKDSILINHPNYSSIVNTVASLDETNKLITITLTGQYCSLEKAKELKRSEIQEKRENVKSLGFLYGGIRFDCDEISTNKIDSVVSIIQTQRSKGITPQNIDWVVYDNSVVTLTPDEMEFLGLAAGDYVKGVHAAATIHNMTILNLNDVTLVADYDYNTGWPSDDKGGTISSIA